MSDNVMADLMVALFGAVVTSLLTVGIAFVTYLINKRAEERQVLRVLIDDIHHRRAVGPDLNVRPVPNAEQSNDFDRVNQSILEIRRRAALAREKVRLKSPARKSLANIIVDCNRYLELTERDPDNYLYELYSLRSELWKNIQKICHGYLFIEPLEPGESSL